MSVDIKLLGWRAKGLRCPDYNISLVDASDEPHRTVLIQMPNGTGKTTTLELLRAALSGTAQEWREEDLREYSKSENGSTGLFEVRLLHNRRRVTIQMNFDFAAGVVRYSTTLPGGQKQGFHPPRDLVRFFQSNFVRFFIFDGELATNLLDTEHTDAQRAIGDLFQLSTFSAMKTRISEYWEHKVEGRTAKTEKGYTRRKNEKQLIEQRLQEARERQRKETAERARVSSILTEKKKQFDERIAKQEELEVKLKEADAELQDAKAEVSLGVASALHTMRNPHALLPDFAHQMFSLKESLDRVKLPASAAREFFQELIEEDECVCGRPLDQVTRQQLLQRSERYLASENMSLLNAMKTDIDEAVGTDPDAPHDHLIATLKELQDAIDREQKALNDRDRIIEQGASKDPDVDSVRGEIKELEDDLKELDRRLERYQDPSSSAPIDEIWGVSVLDQKLEEAEDALGEITETLDLKRKRDVLLDILTDAHEEAKANVSREVCRDANSRIQELMPHNSIRIDRIDDSLRLKGQKQGSQGETLTVAYAFLATLFNRADHQLPFVVDSPAGPIDLEVRDRIGRLVPHLTNQFIAFTISSERQKFVPALEASADHDVVLLTLFRKRDGQLVERARQEPRFEETDDGMLVWDRNFFNDFQLDTEEEYNAL